MDENYTIVSELSHEGGDKMTPTQAKLVILIICLLFVFGLFAMLISVSKDKSALALEQGDVSLEERVLVQREAYADLMKEADELFESRLRENTFDDVVEIEMILSSYGFKEQEKSWFNKNVGTVSFDSYNLVLQFVGLDEKSQTIRVAQNGTLADDYYCKLGKEFFILNQSDIVALGRLLVGAYGFLD